MIAGRLYGEEKHPSEHRYMYIDVEAILMTTSASVYLLKSAAKWLIFPRGDCVRRDTVAHCAWDVRLHRVFCTSLKLPEVDRGTRRMITRTINGHAVYYDDSDGGVLEFPDTITVRPGC